MLNILIVILWVVITIITAYPAQSPRPTPRPFHVLGDSRGNIKYDVVSRSEQEQLKIVSYDVAPMPIEIDQIYYTHLRGHIGKNVTGLEEIQFRILMTGDLENGNRFGPLIYTFPVKDFVSDGFAHITIRYPEGKDRVKFGRPVQHGVSKVFDNFSFYSGVIETGQYSFMVQGVLPATAKRKERYLFALRTSAWLEGRRSGQSTSRPEVTTRHRGSFTLADPP